MIDEDDCGEQMECRLAGETEVLGENLPQRHLSKYTLYLSYTFTIHSGLKENPYFFKFYASLCYLEKSKVGTLRIELSHLLILSATDRENRRT
jgi:hypothetical protein